MAIPLAQVAAHPDHTPERLEIEGNVLPTTLLALRQHGNGTTYLEATGPNGLLYDMENRFSTSKRAEDLLAGFTDGTLGAFMLGEEGTPTTRSLYVLVVEIKNRAGPEITGERKDLMLFTRMKDFAKRDPFFDEAPGLQATRLVLS
jgi:hypothetical protein